MRPHPTFAISRLLAAGTWISVGGTFLLILGLIWDVTIHEGDPSLASHESVFTVDNPAHVVFLAGISLIVGGMLLFVIDRVRAQRATGRRGRTLTFAAVAVALALVAGAGATAAVETQFTAPVAGTLAAHAHATNTPGGSPAPDHHATFVTTGPGCAPAGTLPTPDQNAAAAALVASVKAAWSPTLTAADATALGYRPPKTPAAGGVLTHFSNPVLAASNTDLLDPTRPQALVFVTLPDGRQVLAGVLFTAPIGEGPCPGGSATLWHFHKAGATREMLHVWLFDNPTGSFATGIGGRAGLAIAQRELEGAAPAGTSAPG